MPLDSDLTWRAIERELELVAGTVRMVAAGAAPAVTLVGLVFESAVVEAWAADAAGAGVILEPLWHPDDSSCDIRIRQAVGEADHD